MAGILKQLAVIAALGAAGYGGWIAWSERSGATVATEAQRARGAPGVVVAAARRDRVERTVSAVGTGRARQSVDLATVSEGRVVEIGFQGGDMVAEGAVLLRLDDRAQRAALAEEQAELDRARSAFARAETLLRGAQISQTVFETARADFASAEATVDQARKALDDRTLRAPFAGVVGYREVDAGAVVRSNTVIATLDDLGAIDVDFALPERFYAEVTQGMPVRAASEAFPGEVFEGVLASVSRRVDPATRAFTARARIPNPDLRLPAGSFMRVDVVLEAREGVTAPEEAIIVEGGTHVVYVVADDRAQRREIALGARRDGRAEIVGGLAEGELVITRGVQKVADGRPVRVVSVEGERPDAREPAS